MYTTRWCGDCQSYRRWFDAHHISYDVIDIDRDDQAAASVMQVNGGMRSVPAIVFPDGSVLVEPTSRELAANKTVLLGESSNTERRTSMPDETHLLVLCR